MYLPAEERNEKEVLRLLNTSYIYGVLLQRVAPASCKKLTWRKIFGIYYHAITTHMPITFKYIALSSLNAEDDERQFSTINSISRGTSNRKSDHILSNSIIRMQAEKRCFVRSGKYRESRVSNFSKSLPPLPDTVFDSSWLHRSDHQPHIERLADYIKCGRNVWWHLEGKKVVWHDGSSQPGSRMEGPSLLTFMDVNQKLVGYQLKTLCRRKCA